MTDLEKLMEAVLNSPRYREISPELVRSIGQDEVIKRSSLKEAIKATKSKLHQVGGAYLDAHMDYQPWLEELTRTVEAGDQESFRSVCKDVMAHHSSTRERLPFLERFYKEIFVNLPPIHSLLDVACGLNPLALPWMNLPPDVSYMAIDIYEDLIHFLNGFFPLASINGYAKSSDVLKSIPDQPFDLAFILKAIPCLEQVDKSAGKMLLDTIQANILVISFPVHSLGGHIKGMPENYSRHFKDLVAGRNWDIRQLEFPTELVYILRR